MKIQITVQKLTLEATRAEYEQNTHAAVGPTTQDKSPPPEKNQTSLLNRILGSDSSNSDDRKQNVVI